jgi:neuropilin and tolloid-like protein
LKNFCGTAADAVTSKSNILHIRYFAEHTAINSQFGMIYTAFRDKDKDGESFKSTIDCHISTPFTSDSIYFIFLKK